MSGRSQRLRWFGGLYLASLAALALTALLIRTVLWLAA
ncbi:hypothetical protein V1289_001169 [Bradyrhizobium sp. AZCC 2289]